MLHRSAWSRDEIRAEFTAAAEAAGNPTDAASIDRVIQGAIAASRAQPSRERLSGEDLAAATVFAADDVAHWWNDLPEDTNFFDLVDVVMPPFDVTWVEFQGAPNKLGALAWGVLCTVTEHDDDMGFPWHLQIALVIEWGKGKPIGPVAWFGVPLDPHGRMLPEGEPSEDGSHSRGVRGGWGGRLAEIEGMSDEEERTWVDNLGPRWVGPALFAFSLLHCKNVDRVEHRPAEKMSNRHRKRTGRPLTRYWTLDVGAMRRVLETDGDVQRSGLRHALHICRGHFKTYTPDAPLFGQHVGTYWWPAVARGDKTAGEVVKDYRVRVEHGGLGRPAQERDESPELLRGPDGPGEPDLSGRGLAAHRRIENLVIAAVRAAGHQPRDPSPAEPQYDVGWETPTTIWLVEVKSLTPANAVSQLRYGIGQLVEYASRIAAGDGRAVRCVLAVEQEPPVPQGGPDWATICRENEIVLLWPDTFDRISHLEHQNQ